MKKVLMILAYIAIALVFTFGLILAFAGEKDGYIILALAVLLFFLVKRSQKRAASAAAPIAAQTPTAAPVPSPAPAAEQAPEKAPDSYKSANAERHSLKASAFQEELNSIPKVEIVLSETKATRRKPTDMPEIKFSNITRRTVIEKLFPLVVVDTETTGLTPRGNDIIEVSAIRYEAGFKPVSCFTTLLRSRNPIPPEASAVNSITDEMVKDQPYFSQVAASFSEYISGCNIVGHNLSYDLKFLFCCGAELPDNVKYIDTLDLAKHTLTSPRSKQWDSDSGYAVPVDDYDVEDFKLGTLCDYYGIVLQNAHRSLSDCLATGKVLERLIEDKTK